MYFPKTVSGVNGEGASRQALEKLDPNAGSVVLEPYASVRQDPGGTASIAAYDTQSYRVQYRAASPSLLKLSESWYPGWRAFIGANEIPVVRVDHALMGAVVPAVPPGRDVQLDVHIVVGHVVAARVVRTRLVHNGNLEALLGRAGPDDLDVAVARLPGLSNATDFWPLARLPGVTKLKWSPGGAMAGPS